MPWKLALGLGWEGRKMPEGLPLLICPTQLELLLLLLKPKLTHFKSVLQPMQCKGVEALVNPVSRLCKVVQPQGTSNAPHNHTLVTLS